MPPYVKKPSAPSQIWFIQNMTREGPAYFAELLTRWKIPFQICDLERGDVLPQVGSRDAVVVLGGSMSANDTTDSMLRLLQWTQALLKRNIPYLGICLGLQTLVKAAGGQVKKSPVKELGLKADGKSPYTCERTQPSQKDLLLNQMPRIFPIFQLHGETVELTDSMVLLAEGKGCKNQIVKTGEKAYGLQGHLEVTLQTVAAWLRDDEDLMTQDPQTLLSDLAVVESELHSHCQKIFFNFLKIAGMLK